MDSSGNAYVTGSVYNDDVHYSEGVTLKYSPTGAALWTNVINSTAIIATSPRAIAVDPNRNVYVASFSGVSDNNPDFVTVKYSGPSTVPPLLEFITTNGGFGFTNNQVVLTLTGPAGSNAVISASADLQNWVPLTTNQLIGGIFNFTDTRTTNLARRFYRATFQ